MNDTGSTTATANLVQPNRLLASTPMEATRRSILCRIAIHRWIYEDRRTPTEYQTYARCARPGCRYHNWIFVNADPRPHYDTDEQPRTRVTG